MSLNKYFNIKSKTTENQQMEIENPEKTQNMPWVQKYRPNKLDELSYQQEVTQSLKNTLKTGNLPHLLFYGPAGTGKTSAIIALSKELFGPTFYKKRILELNASDERGINIIREKVKKFAQQVCVKNTDKTYLCPNYKIIVLDEADLMTNEAQSALRRVIEDNSTLTRFCIICNYITKIIEPVSSRCVKFRFKPIPVISQLDKLNYICKMENINLNQKQISTLLEKGDLRQSINSLQSLNKLSKISEILLPISQDYCTQVVQQLKIAQNIKEVIEIGKYIYQEGYAYDELLNGISKYIIFKYDQQKNKAMILEVLSKAEESLLEGATEFPVIDVLTSIYYVMNMSI